MVRRAGNKPNVIAARNVAQAKPVQATVDVPRPDAFDAKTQSKPVAKVTGVRDFAGVDSARWGAFVGRLISRISSPQECDSLDELFKAGRYDQQLHLALTLNNQFTTPPAKAHIARVAAGIDFAKRALYGKLDDKDAALLKLVEESDPAPIDDHPKPLTLHDGDLEGTLFKWAKLNVPGLASAIVDNHPLIAQPHQLVGTAACADVAAREQGKFLADYNVMTVMHQLGSTPGWLDLLEDKLGLDKSQYLGVSVPYSGSKVAMHALNKRGWTTLDEHDPRPEPMQMLMRAMGRGDRKSFDERKEVAITKALERVLSLAETNQKPILVVDDGGYVAKLVSTKFPAHADKFKIVEWTQRGITLYEALKGPRPTLISAAESKPKKEIEPAYIADASIENLVASLTNELGSLKKKRVCVLGQGSIGKAAADALEALGATVTRVDKDPKRGRSDVKRAIKGQDVVIGATGHNSMPPEVFRELDPNTVVASVSSVDIETRNDRAPEHARWGVDDNRVSLRVTNRESARRRPRRRARRGENPISTAGHRAVQSAIEDRLAGYGVSVQMEERRVLSGGFPLNLNRRLRLMNLKREELILMNVTEAIAQAAETPVDGQKHDMSAEREQRIIDEHSRALDG